MYPPLHVKPGCSKEKRAEICYERQKNLLHAFIKEVIAKWEMVLEVQVKANFVQRMKTKWGSCNYTQKTSGSVPGWRKSQKTW